MAVIIGIRYEVKDTEAFLRQVGQVSKDMGMEIQVLDANMVFGQEHLELAVEKAERAFAQGRNLSKSIGTEVMLYAGSERQISKAIGKMGIKEGQDDLAVIIHGAADPDELTSRMGWKRDDSVLAPDIGHAEAYGIRGADDPSILKRIIEKIALSELDR